MLLSAHVKKYGNPAIQCVGDLPESTLISSYQKSNGTTLCPAPDNIWSSAVPGRYEQILDGPLWAPTAEPRACSWMWRRGRRAGDVSTSMGYLWRLTSQLGGGDYELLDLELLTGLGGDFLLHITPTSLTTFSATDRVREPVPRYNL